MIQIRHERLEELAQRHANAVANRLNASYGGEDDIFARFISALPGMEDADVGQFIKADVGTMRLWVEQCPELLKFGVFGDMYTKYFSNGANQYLHRGYNAYSLIEALDITVCPYCEDEYLDVMQQDDKRKRTSELDHFFPKGKYPALAMCFFNLVPSGKACNGLKLVRILGVSPYEAGIENLTFLYPNLPVGINFDTVRPEDCVIDFHPEGGMERNVTMLCLDSRYKRHAEEALKLLRKSQRYTRDKINEMVRMGFGSYDGIIEDLFGPIDPAIKKHELRQKMKHDLTGR